MKSKFKVGQTVIVSEKPIDKSGQPHWVSSMDCTKGKVGVVSNVFEGSGGWYVKITGDNFHGGYSYHQDWLTLVGYECDTKRETSGITIPVSELKRIYDVACNHWQDKIQSMVVPFQDEVFVSAGKIEEMLKAATSTQRPIVEDVFKTYLRESKPKFFDFGEEHTLDLQTVMGNPMYIRHGLANDGYEDKEIGLSDEYTPILVDKDGNETELTPSHYLKFKTKK
jgi:hypothetical protein